MKSSSFMKEREGPFLQREQCVQLENFTSFLL